MEAKKGSIYPLIVIKTPNEHSFYQEHHKIIQKYGYVWFAKLGKSSLKVSSIIKCDDILFIKDSGNLYSGLYAAKILEVTDSIPTETCFPDYYDTLHKKGSLWFMIEDLKPVSVDVLSNSFVGNSSGGSVLNILRSICPAFFIKCTNTQRI